METKTKDELKTRPYIRRTGRTRRLASVLLIVAGFSFCELAYGETFNDKCEKIKDQLAKTKCTQLNEFSEALTKFMKTKNEAERVSISVEAGYNGDISNTDQRQLINLSSSINKDVYPIAFRFKAGALFSSKPNQSQDQVTTFLVNLDYHVLPWLETYAFVERFTDTFMSIRERYETGGGVKIELDFIDPTKRKNKKNGKLFKDIEFIETLQGKIKEIRDALKSADTQKCLKDGGVERQAMDDFIESLEMEVQKLSQALKKQAPKINLGLAITAMSEMEQAADLTIDVLDVNTNQKTRTIIYAFTPTQRYRIVFRPSINYKINDYLTLYSYLYIKEPLARPLYDNGKRDWRYDGVFDAKIDLLKDTSWGGELSVIIEYQIHYDNVPPYIPSQKINELINQGETLSRNAADNRHQMASIKIGVKF